MSNGNNATTTTTRYDYATDSASGYVEADSLDGAYDSLRANITAEQVADGATLWVEDAAGVRLTMGIDRD